MDITQEFVDGLKVNEVAVMKKIAEELSIRIGQVSAVIALIDEGCTVPFISRYRKEKTGSLDEVQVRDVAHLFQSGKNLETRRLEIVKGIFDQGKLSEGLYENIAAAVTLTELEDLYAPFKRKKKTRGMVAQEKGLEPLADAMLQLDDKAVVAKAAEFVKEDAEHPELSVASAEDAIQGAQDILAERLSQDPANRAKVKAYYISSGRLVVKGVGSEDDKRTSTYQMYWDFAEALSQVKPHRVLAINRGEREEKLEVVLEVDEDGAIANLRRSAAPVNSYHSEAIADGLLRLLSPAVLRELRGDKADEADDHGISVFSLNLKNLLMQQPIKGTRVLGVDPGERTGTKCAALDETGKYLGSFVVYQIHKQKEEENKRAILKAIKDYDVQLVAIGNGTGTREVQELVSAVLTENNLDVLYTVVDEDGASVYSASDVAREEFPELDLTIRGAISIGRRLQDPLAELVKIDPKSIGVGLYQHDLNQKKLSDSLDEVVSSVVNNVGVNLNTASASLLKYVSGVSSSLAKKIVRYRDEKGRIGSRSELMDVSGMGPKTYEQCAGFLKIPESGDPLDNSWVHPENYEIAREIRDHLSSSGSISSELRAELKTKYSVGDTTIDDLVEELKKPNRDPRDGFPKPVMQKGVVKFEDLSEGMKVTGKVKNVVDFGAFIDLGIKETALVHISEMSDTFVTDPLSVLKVGDVREFTVINLDVDRRRIGLSLRSADRRSGASSVASFRGSDGASPAGRSSPSERQGSGAKRVVVRKGDRPASDGRHGDGQGRDQRRGAGNGAGTGGGNGSGFGASDDGTMYNPFAELLKKSKEGKKGRR